MDEESLKIFFIGYSPESHGYRLFDYVSKKIFVSRDVKFDGWNLVEMNGKFDMEQLEYAYQITNSAKEGDIQDVDLIRFGTTMKNHRL